MNVFIISILILSGAITYCLVVLMNILNWSKSGSTFKKENPEQSLSVTVLVPVKNEEKNIPEMLKKLTIQVDQLQNYEAELVVINDHSSDNSENILIQNQTEYNFRFHTLPDFLNGKKAAITYGIEKSDSDIIVVTDADCNWLDGWLQNLVQPFSDRRVNFVQGMVLSERGRGLLGYFQALESMALQVFTAAAFYRKKPGMGNGASMAFRQKSFLEIGGYDQSIKVRSGDDVFLIEALHKKGLGKMIYNREALIFTHSPENVHEMVLQKLRWAGKWKHYGNNSLKWSGLMVFVINLYFLAVWISFISGTVPLILFAIVSGLKILSEGVIAMLYSKYTHFRFNLLYFLIMVFLYPLYAVIFGLGGLFITPKWK